MLMANSICTRCWSRGISTDVQRTQCNAVNRYAEIPRLRRHVHTLFDVSTTPPLLRRN